MPKYMRCVVDHIAVTVRASEYCEAFGNGKVADFTRVLISATLDKSAYTLGDALQGLHHCFVPVVDDVPAFVAHSDADASKE